MSSGRPAPGGPDGRPEWTLDGDEPIAGMPERLIAATPTRLAGWASCPRRYRFTYLERPPPRRGPAWARTAVGAAVHTALARWWRERPATRTPERAAVLLAGAWIGDGFRDRAQEAAVYRRTADALVRYATTHEHAARPLGVERTVAIRTRVLALSGRVDRIDVRRAGAADDGPGSGGTELVIVDYKTGRRPPGPDEAGASLALAVYAVAAERTLHRTCRRVELHHLPSGVVLAHDHTGPSLRAALERADQIGRELRTAGRRWAGGLSAREVDAVFPPRPGPGCAWCDFRVSCAEGATASRALPPWAGVDDEPVGTADDGPAADTAVVD